MRRTPHSYVVLALMPLLGVGLAALYYLPGTDALLWKADRLVLDGFHQAGAKTPPRQDVVILGIDEASQKLDSLWPEDIEASPELRAMQHSYPWSRKVWAGLLDRLFSAGARQVFLDLTFKAPSADPEDDRALKEAIEKYKGRVILGGKFEEIEVREGMGTHTQLSLPPASLGVAEEDVGHLNYWTERDVVRMAAWQVSMTEAELRHAAAAGHEVEAELQTELAQDAGAEYRVPSVSLMAARNIDPALAKYAGRQSRIRFSQWDAYAPLSLFQVFVPDLWSSNFEEGKFFAGKTVFVGATATDFQDFQSTPVGRMAGVQLHAHVLSALLQEQTLTSAPWWWPALAVAVGLVLSLLLVKGIDQPLFALLGMLILGYGAVLAGRWIFDKRSLEISPVPLMLAVGVCGIAGLAGNQLAQRQETKRLRRYLTRYTSSEQVAEMLKDRAGLYTTLGGVERRVTVLFSDVRGFTSMAENMSPGEIVAQLNEYLSGMVGHIFRERGLVDKFIGDAIMALWGSTRVQQGDEECAQDARQAVSTALKMRTTLTKLNDDWRQRGMQQLHIGVGIHQGPVVVGNIGSAAPWEKMDLTVIGDAVNLASRLEGATKQYGVDLIVSEAIEVQIKDTFLCRSADMVRVKGKVQPVKIFTVLSEADAGSVPGLAEYENGVQFYRKGEFAAAAHAFQAGCEMGLDDTLTQLYLQRCQELEASPPETWDGVYVMKTK